MVEFQVQDMLVFSAQTNCHQPGQIFTPAWVSSTNGRLSLLRCTDLVYGEGKIVISDFEVPFNIIDTPMSTISTITPKIALSGRTHYVFQVIGIFQSRTICIFSLLT